MTTVARLAITSTNVALRRGATKSTLDFWQRAGVAVRRDGPGHGIREPWDNPCGQHLRRFWVGARALLGPRGRQGRVHGSGRERDAPGPQLLDAYRTARGRSTMSRILAINMLIYGLIASFCLSTSYCGLLLLAKGKLWPAYVYLRLFSIVKCWSNLSYEVVCGYRRLILASFNLSIAIGGYV